MTAHLKSVQQQGETVDELSLNQFSRSKRNLEKDARKKGHRRAKSLASTDQLKKNSESSIIQALSHIDLEPSEAPSRYPMSRRRSLSTPNISNLCKDFSTKSNIERYSDKRQSTADILSKVNKPQRKVENVESQQTGRPLSRKTSMSTPDVRIFRPSDVRNIRSRISDEYAVVNNFVPRVLRARTRKSNQEEYLTNSPTSFASMQHVRSSYSGSPKSSTKSSLPDRDKRLFEDSFDFNDLMSDVQNAHARKSLSDKDQYMVYLNHLVSDAQNSPLYKNGSEKNQHLSSSQENQISNGCRVQERRSNSDKDKHLDNSLNNIIAGIPNAFGRNSSSDRDYYLANSLDNITGIPKGQGGQSLSSKDKYSTSSVDNLLAGMLNIHQRNPTPNNDRYSVSSLDNLLATVSCKRGIKSTTGKDRYSISSFERLTTATPNMRAGKPISEKECPSMTSRSLQDVRHESANQPSIRSYKRVPLSKTTSISMDVTRRFHTSEDDGDIGPSKRVSLNITLKL